MPWNRETLAFDLHDTGYILATHLPHLDFDNQICNLTTLTRFSRSLARINHECQTRSTLRVRVIFTERSYFVTPLSRNLREHGSIGTRVSRYNGRDLKSPDSVSHAIGYRARSKFICGGVAGEAFAVKFQQPTIYDRQMLHPYNTPNT